MFHSHPYQHPQFLNTLIFPKGIKKILLTVRLLQLIRHHLKQPLVSLIQTSIMLLLSLKDSGFHLHIIDCVASAIALRNPYF